MKDCPSGFFCITQNKVIMFSLIFVIIFFYLSHNKQNNNDNNKQFKNEIKTINQKLDEQNEIIENKINVINHEHKPTLLDMSNPMFVVNKNYQRTVNPLLPPLRSYPNSNLSVNIRNIGVPINIPTRGPVGEYQQIGVLSNESNDKVLPLYGRPTHTNSNKWSYYTSTDKFNQLKLPIDYKSKKCTGEYGCEEIYNGDEIQVPFYKDKKFKVTIYELDAPRYIPYV